MPLSFVVQAYEDSLADAVGDEDAFPRGILRQTQRVLLHIYGCRCWPIILRGLYNHGLRSGSTV